jgi:hypothetical protein
LQRAFLFADPERKRWSNLGLQGAPGGDLILEDPDVLARIIVHAVAQTGTKSLFQFELGICDSPPRGLGARRFRCIQSFEIPQSCGMFLFRPCHRQQDSQVFFIFYWIFVSIVSLPSHRLLRKAMIYEVSAQCARVSGAPLVNPRFLQVLIFSPKNDQICIRISRSQIPSGIPRKF